jgi:hypothetical protein
MKNFIILISLTFIAFIPAMAQSTVTPDSRLLVLYSEDYLDNLVVNDPQQLLYLNWYLDNSWEIVEAGIEKCEQMPYLKSFDLSTKTVGENVTAIDEEDFNIFLFYFDRQYSKKAYYRVGNTGYAIAFDSFKNLTKKFNLHQNED